MNLVDKCKDWPNAHHVNCRKRNAGAHFRRSMNPDNPQFECPHGFAWIEDAVPHEFIERSRQRKEICKNCESALNEGRDCVHSPKRGCAFCFDTWRSKAENHCHLKKW